MLRRFSQWSGACEPGRSSITSLSAPSRTLEILLELKGCRNAVDFTVVDITRPRDPELLRKTRGTTTLPVLETEDGRILKESLVLLGYLDERLDGGAVRRCDPYEHAVEQMLIAREGSFTAAGYGFVMNQDRDARPAHVERMLTLFAELDGFLVEHAPDRVYLFEAFGLAEAVFTSLFMRFWFLEYYEGFELPPDASFDRVRPWREACLAHPAARQVCREELSSFTTTMPKAPETARCFRGARSRALPSSRPARATVAAGRSTAPRRAIASSGSPDLRRGSRPLAAERHNRPPYAVSRPEAQRDAQSP